MAKVKYSGKLFLDNDCNNVNKSTWKELILRNECVMDEDAITDMLEDLADSLDEAGYGEMSVSVYECDDLSVILECSSFISVAPAAENGWIDITLSFDTDKYEEAAEEEE